MPEPSLGDGEFPLLSQQDIAMRTQLRHLTLILLATSAGWLNLCGCSTRTTSVHAVDREIRSAIIRDLDLPDRGTEVVHLTSDGDRDVAIVLTTSNPQHTLWCVYRSRNERDQEARDWRLWINQQIIEDGTGAEEPAKREYSEIPDAKTIAAFRSDVLNHWSSR